MCCDVLARLLRTGNREANGSEHGKASHNILHLSEAAEMYLVGILEEKQEPELRTYIHVV